jgi:hypothetical protein
MIPLMEAYPETVERLRGVEIPAALPVVDIVAERTWLDAPTDVEAFRKAPPRLRRRVTQSTRASSPRAVATT